jgi:hypothetical protein
MRTPTVTESPLPLEAVGEDTLIDDLAPRRRRRARPARGITAAGRALYAVTDKRREQGEEVRR